MALKNLWTGSPCRRPVMTPERNRFEIGWGMVRHARMALRYLWAGWPCRRPARRPPSPRDNLYPMARSLPVCAGAHASLSLPLSASLDLREIHLARQSSLQVPVGHITVPGGIKLCSPGTFLVANYLIINNGSYQVNFTKPNRATLRYTNSQWLREDATEASVGRVAVPKCR